MDLNIRDRTALVCAGSRGLGRACALALAREGVAVTITGRSPDTLMRTAEEICAATGREVSVAAGDIATEEGRESALTVCPYPDILVTNAGGPPIGRFETFDRSHWMAAIEANMMAPLMLIAAVHPGMRSRRFGRIINITSAYVKAPVANLPLSSGPRAGLTGALSFIAREGVADNVTINNLLPEMILTDRARAGFSAMAEEAGETPEAFIATFVASLPARRLGDPEEFGSVCAFLCSTQAAYVTNQNIVVDGGHYAGLF